LTALNVPRFRCRRRSDWRARLIVDLWITGMAHLLCLKSELLSYGMRNGQVDPCAGSIPEQELYVIADRSVGTRCR
jgi:hypothetical protein